MPLQYSQFAWGFEVHDSGPNQNNRIAFIRNGTTFDGDGANPAGTMKAGVYTADELAAEVQRAMRERTGSVDITCAFDYVTLKFTTAIASPGNLSLLFAGTVAATDCDVLLGYNPSNHNTDGANNGDTYLGDFACRGFEVFSSGSSQNNRLAFTRNGTTYDGDGANPAATMSAGVYTPDALAAEVQRAMRERTSTTDITCSYSPITGKFTIAIAHPGNLSLLFAGTVAATDCNVLLGFNSTNRNTDGANDGDSYSSDRSAERPVAWAPIEPLLYTSPARVSSLNTVMPPASGTARVVATVQRVSDSGAVESIHFSTLRAVQLSFRALTPDEQARMEAFLDWISKGKRVTWQPDKTTGDGMKLTLANPGAISSSYEWLTRPEVGYGTLSFYEQLS